MRNKYIIDIKIKLNFKEMDAESKNPLLTSQTFDYRNTLVSIGAGGCAGMSIDLALFPVDTIKTRI